MADLGRGTLGRADLRTMFQGIVATFDVEARTTVWDERLEGYKAKLEGDERLRFLMQDLTATQVEASRDSVFEQ